MQNNEDEDDDIDRRKDADNSNNDGNTDNNTGPVYVVYPVNSAVNIGSQEDTVERDESVVIGTRGPHRPLPPDTLPQDEDDSSTTGEDKIDKIPGLFYGKRPHSNAVNSDFSSQVFFIFLILRLFLLFFSY